MKGSKVSGMSAADPFFAKRLQIYPKRVKGTFRRIKWAALLALLTLRALIGWMTGSGESEGSESSPEH